MSLFDTLRDAAQKLHEYTVETPTGDTIDIAMRALTPAEQLAVERAEPMPAPPVNDIQRVDGVVQKIYDTRDKVYIEQSQDAMRRRAYRQIIMTWAEPVPGDTEEEQITALGELPAWVVSALVRVVGEINTLKKDQLAPRSFRAAGNTKK